jgi:hypothetical protein
MVSASLQGRRLEVMLEGAHPEQRNRPSSLLVPSLDAQSSLDRMS